LSILGPPRREERQRSSYILNIKVVIQDDCMQLFDFAVVFFSNECRGVCGCCVVWLKEMAVLESERRGRSSYRGYQQVSVARQCWASMAKVAWIFWDWTVMGRIRKEKCCTRTGDLTSGLWTRLGNTVPVEGARMRAWPVLRKLRTALPRFRFSSRR
jgi:hypothetical protein